MKFIVCARCGKGGEGGPLLKVEKGHYRHKQCLASQIGNVNEVRLPPHAHPKLWVAQVRPPKLEDILGSRS